MLLLSPLALLLIGSAVTMLKWMPLSLIRSAFRHSGPVRWSLSSTHSRGLLIRARSGRCDLIFLFTFSPAAAIQLGKAWRECVHWKTAIEARVWPPSLTI